MTTGGIGGFGRAWICGAAIVGYSVAVGYALAAPFCPRRSLPGLAAFGPAFAIILVALVAGTIAAIFARTKNPLLGGFFGSVTLTVPALFFLIGPFIGSVCMGLQSFLTWMWLQNLMVLLGLAGVGTISGACGVVAFHSGWRRAQAKARRPLGKRTTVAALLLLCPFVVAGYRWAFVRVTLATMPDIERRLFGFLPDWTYENGELVKLSLANNVRFGDTNLEGLGTLPKLRELNLTGTAIVGSGLEHLKTMPNLETLRLAETRLKDEGLKYLGELKQLRYLDLRGTSISDAGVAHLASCRTLRYLKLSNTFVGDEGLHQIAQLTGLTSLNLANTTVTDQGMKKLEALKDLKDLWVTKGPLLTEEGCAALKGTNPRLRIHIIGR